MFRKIVLALGATAVIGAAALSPTAASAKGWSWKHHHHFWHSGFVFAAPVVDDDCYLVRKVHWRHHHRIVRVYEVCD